MATVGQHDIIVRGRNSIELTGISSVDSFDVNEFHLKTTTGPLIVQGSNLHMKHLDLDVGAVVIEGTLNSLTYAPDPSNKKRLSSRLFR